MAFGVMMVAPVLVVFLAFQRWFVQGVASAGLKGQSAGRAEERSMFDDLIESLIEDLPVGSGNVSKRAQVLFRLFFGFLGAFLGIAGMVKFIVDPPGTGNTAMWISILALFFFLACFCLFNVAFLRKWRWPGVLFLISLVMLFVTRIAFGA